MVVGLFLTYRDFSLAMRRPPTLAPFDEGPAVPIRVEHQTDLFSGYGGGIYRLRRPEEVLGETVPATPVLRSVGPVGCDNRVCDVHRFETLCLQNPELQAVLKAARKVGYHKHLSKIAAALRKVFEEQLLVEIAETYYADEALLATYFASQHAYIAANPEEPGNEDGKKPAVSLRQRTEVQTVLSGEGSEEAVQPPLR